MDLHNYLVAHSLVTNDLDNKTDAEKPVDQKLDIQ